MQLKLLTFTDETEINSINIFLFFKFILKENFSETEENIFEIRRKICNSEEEAEKRL